MGLCFSEDGGGVGAALGLQVLALVLAGHKVAAGGVHVFWPHVPPGAVSETHHMAWWDLAMRCAVDLVVKQLACVERGMIGAKYAADKSGLRAVVPELTLPDNTFGDDVQLLARRAAVLAVIESGRDGLGLGCAVVKAGHIWRELISRHALGCAGGGPDLRDALSPLSHRHLAKVNFQ